MTEAIREPRTRVECVHCKKRFTVHPGGTQIRGWCFKCNGAFCGPDCDHPKTGRYRISPSITIAPLFGSQDANIPFCVDAETPSVLVDCPGNVSFRYEKSEDAVGFVATDSGWWNIESVPQRGHLIPSDKLISSDKMRIEVMSGRITGSVWVSHRRDRLEHDVYACEVRSAMARGLICGRGDTDVCQFLQCRGILNAAIKVQKLDNEQFQPLRFMERVKLGWRSYPSWHDAARSVCCGHLMQMGGGGLHDAFSLHRTAAAGDMRVFPSCLKEIATGCQKETGRDVERQVSAAVSELISECIRFEKEYAE